MKDKDRKGLFKITKVKTAIGGVIGAVIIAAAAHFTPFENVTNLFGGNSDKDFEKEMVTSSDEQLENSEPEQSSEPVNPPVEETEPELTPEDEGYYFDEEDEEDYYFDEEDEEIQEEIQEETQNEHISNSSLENDDFKDLIIPNINAYKGKGNSIVDALRMCGYPSDKSYRARLAAFFGIEDYSYTAEQNLKLLDCLYQYYAYLLDNTDPTVNPIPDNDNKDDKTDNNEEHTCVFGDWESYNDEKERRTCSCGKYEERDHNYGPWLDLGNGKEARICNHCGHVHERNKQNDKDDEKHTCSFGNWESYNDEKERRTCSCGKYEERDHAYGPWLDLGNGKEARICNNCGHVHERNKQEVNECDHTLGEWKDNGDGTCTRSCECGDKKETQAHVKGELISTEYIVENDMCIEVNTYYCANCKTKFYTKTDHGKVIRVPIDGDENNHQLICETDGRVIGTEAHSLGEPTITYLDNGDGTHTKTTTYHCSVCNKDIVIREVLSHGTGTWEAIDEQYEHLVDECGYEIAYGEHPYNKTVNEDGSIDFSCPNCGQTKHQDAPEHTHTEIEVGRRYLNDGSGNCYVPIIGCVDGDMDTYEGTPVGHDLHEVSNDGNEIEYKCSRQECKHSETVEIDPFSVQEEDDFDYEVADDDDFDLQEGDIPETAFLNLDRQDIEYMANRAIARLDLENALDEEMQARSLTLTYKA
ncbi:MAG: hypothetical protein OSJ70_03550 [Bacilli bacterium]|nr:hypothetical protein [Bacilli bacterium]